MKIFTRIVTKIRHHRTKWKKTLEIMGLFDAFLYRGSYLLHTHTYIGAIGKREIKLQIYGKYPVWLRLFSRDLDFFESIFIGRVTDDGKCVGEYDIDFSHSTFESVVDLGANVGLFSLLYAIRYPYAKIIALEPEDHNFALLKKNVALFPNVICERRGVWWREAFCRVFEGRVIVNTSKTVSEGSYYIDECPPLEDGATEAVSIGWLLRKFELKDVLIKMDVEGAEREIFQKGKLDWLASCKALVMETHEWLFKDCDIDIFIMQLMNQHGYIFSELGENKIFLSNRLDSCD